MIGDRSKCSNEACTIKNNCLRWTAKAKEYQVYTRFLQERNGECKWMIRDESPSVVLAKYDYDIKTTIVEDAM